MKPFLAHNIGFGLPNCAFYKVELISRGGPSNYYKVGATNAQEALEFAAGQAIGWLQRNRGLDHWRVRECGQFEAVLLTHS